MKAIRQMWAWSMREILKAALGKGRGLLLYLRLVLRWRRWRLGTNATHAHWQITYEQFRDVDQDDFEMAFANALATQVNAEWRADLEGAEDEI